jgi:hypothetical protein
MVTSLPLALRLHILHLWVVCCAYIVLVFLTMLHPLLVKISSCSNNELVALVIFVTSCFPTHVRFFSTIHVRTHVTMWLPFGMCLSLDVLLRTCDGFQCSCALLSAFVARHCGGPAIGLMFSIGFMLHHYVFSFLYPFFLLQT